MELNLGSFAEAWNQLPPSKMEKPKVVVGFSGGRDSWALLHVMHQAGISVIAAHLHHGMRPEADEEAKQLESECLRLGIPFVLGRARVLEIAKARRIGIELAGREARYQFLERVFHGVSANFMATAHTLNDQVETFFLHAIRGSGLNGIGGMSPAHNTLIRPLLGFTREDTTAYCQTHNLSIINDPGNENLDFSRVRVRNKVVPELETIASGFQKSLRRSMEVWRDENEYLNGLAVHALSHCKKTLNGRYEPLTSCEELALCPQEFFRHPLALRRRILILVATYFGSSLTFKQVECIAAEKHEQSGSITSESALLDISWNQDHIHFESRTSSVWSPQFLETDGQVTAENQSWQIRSRAISKSVNDCKREAFSVEVRGDLGPIWVKPFQAEQSWTMTPYGFNHRRKVSDLLSEAKLTLLARKVIPIVCDEAGPIWIPGISFDKRAIPPPGEPARELTFKCNV